MVGVGGWREMKCFVSVQRRDARFVWGESGFGAAQGMDRRE